MCGIAGAAGWDDGARAELAVRRMVGGVLFAALLVGGVQLYLAEQMLFGGALLAGAGLTLVWVMTARRQKS